MKSKYLIAIVALFVARGVQSADVPSGVTDGFKEFAEHGPDAAWTAWTRASSLHNNEAMKSDFIKVSTAAASNLGKSLGGELILSRDISPSVKILYFTWKFERGPLFLRFNCYRVNNLWIVTWIQSSDLLENILPNEKGLTDQKRE